MNWTEGQARAFIERLERKLNKNLLDNEITAYGLEMAEPDLDIYGIILEMKTANVRIMASGDGRLIFTVTDKQGKML